MIISFYITLYIKFYLPDHNPQIRIENEITFKGKVVLAFINTRLKLEGNAFKKPQGLFN